MRITQLIHPLRAAPLRAARLPALPPAAASPHPPSLRCQSSWRAPTPAAPSTAPAPAAAEGTPASRPAKIGGGRLLPLLAVGEVDGARGCWQLAARQPSTWHALCRQQLEFQQLPACSPSGADTRCMMSWSNSTPRRGLGATNTPATRGGCRRVGRRRGQSPAPHSNAAPCRMHDKGGVPPPSWPLQDQHTPGQQPVLPRLQLGRYKTSAPTASNLCTHTHAPVSLAPFVLHTCVAGAV